MLKSIIIAGISLALVLTFFFTVVSPILENQRLERMEECYDKNEAGEWIPKEDKACSIPHYPVLSIALGAIPFLIFIAVFDYLEKKRLHNWRSYK